jgi:glycosyltransferase involved in cell wall biosynthesis
METVYPALDILTLCSNFGEGFPNTLIEAMACGVPCVATDIGASGEIVEGVGLIVAIRDPPALAQAWKSIVTGPMEALAMKARNRVLERYRIERVCKLYESAYFDIACQAEDACDSLGSANAQTTIALPRRRADAEAG